MVVSVKAISWAFECELSVMGEKLTLLALADFADAEGVCWPSLKALSRHTSASQSSVQRYLRGLERRGLIKRSPRRTDGGRFTSDGYVLAIGGAFAASESAEIQWSDTPVVNLTTGHTDASPVVTADHRYIKKEPSLEPSYIPPIPPNPETGGKPPVPDKNPKRKPDAYSPEFDAFWKAWPEPRRIRSDKRKAFERWSRAAAAHGADRISAAAAKYLASPDVRKDGWRYCCLAEVFLNGKLEAAIEAVEPASQTKGRAHYGDERWARMVRAYAAAGLWDDARGPRPTEADIAWARNAG